MTFPLLLALASLAGPPSPSAVATGGSAVIGDADEVVYSFQKREVVFRGDPVVLRREDATLTCKRLVAKNDAQGRIAQAVCTGDVHFVRGTRTVTCDKATYEGAADRIICEGKPVLKDGASEARGNRLVYDLRADEARLEGAQVTLPGGDVDARQREMQQRRRKEGQK